EIPVGARHQYLRFIRALEIRRSAKMVEMAVADDDVLNLLRIQTRFLHSWYEDLFAFFRRVQGVNNNDSPARSERLRPDSVDPDVIEIVKNSCRLELLTRN